METKACSPLLDFLVSGEVFDIEDSSDEDTLVFRLFGVSSRVSAIKNRRAIELKAGSLRNTSHFAIAPLSSLDWGLTTMQYALCFSSEFLTAL